jgi:hypothetical protein
MAGRSARPRRHRMRKAARRESARAWIRSGTTVSIKAYSKRYGVDRYTAYDDLLAIGFALGSSDSRWAVRRQSDPPKRRTDPDTDMHPDADTTWIRDGDEITFVVGHTAGGAPFGYIRDVDGHDEWAWAVYRGRRRPNS